MTLATLIVSFLTIAIVLAATTFALYTLLSKGLSKSARHQQTTRFLLGAAIALLPVFLAGGISGWAICLTAFLSLGWMITYPLLSLITNRQVSSDIDHYMDFGAALYIFPFLITLNVAIGTWLPGLSAVIISMVETCIWLILALQWGYFLLYKGNIDDVGMKVILNTNANEVLEFTRAYSKIATFLIIAVVLLTVSAIFYVNFEYPVCPADLWDLPSWVIGTSQGILAILSGWLLFGPRKGAFIRSGIIKLYIDTRQYELSTRQYLDNRAARLNELKVNPKGTSPKEPHSILLVIGESASRDYMSAFNGNHQQQTTPWMSHMAATDPKHFTIVKNAYSCAFQTVPALEKALTEANQYNDIQFNQSCSIVDIAQRLGYKVTWYSNQGHIGVADTSVSIVAETSETAQWTLQHVGQVHYDHSLLDMLKEVSPNDNNFIVLHLKGSHFNYINRYPPEKTVFGQPGVQDNVLNYINSIRYTDSILQQAWEDATSRLNIQAMVYFSDHAAIPDRHRSPRFDGFGQCRIPLMIWTSDQYIANHPTPYNAIKANAGKYFTNDLAYDLICGILDIDSNHFDPTQSLASHRYRFTRDTLTTYLGTKPLTLDNSDNQ